LLHAGGPLTISRIGSCGLQHLPSIRRAAMSTDCQ
jgi:hypothetical protein